MSLEDTLRKRSGSVCELCGATDNLAAYYVAHDDKGDGVDQNVLACNTCSSQIDDQNIVDPNHWRCLNDSMWSQVPVVQVLAWRMLHRLTDEGWPQDLLDMLYLDDETLTWAKSVALPGSDDQVIHRDSNGAQLEAGDTVTLVKDLVVKGANFTAKRGTAVRGISLVADNAEQIEGKVSGQHIVILTKFVKKST